MGTTRPHIVLFGDSITEQAVQVGENTGWAASLTNNYSRKADVVVRGFAGYNTRLALMLLDGVFPIPSSNPPLVVTVFFGANDAAIPDSGHGTVHVPLEEYRKNTHAILAHLKKRSESTKIILITPPPVSEKALLKYAETLFGDASGVPSRRNEVTKLYAEECVKVGQETNVRVIDLWSSFQEAPDWEDKYLSDGLHLSAHGNAKVFEELLKILDEPGLVPTLKADQMPWDFPHWSEFGEDPVATVRSWGNPSNR